MRALYNEEVEQELLAANPDYQLGQCDSLGDWNAAAKRVRERLNPQQQAALADHVERSKYEPYPREVQLK
jgi:hypothetical protein